MLRKIPTILAAAALVMCVSAQDEKPVEIRRYDIRALVSALTETSARFAFTSIPTRPGGAGESSIKYLLGDEEATDPGDEVAAWLTRLAIGSDPAIDES